MSGKAFIDANVFVYAHDEATPVKQAQARELIAGLMQMGSGAISTQVMQEFYVVSTRKRGVAPLAAKAVLKTFSAFEIVQVTPELVEEAVDCSVVNQVSFWDALIVVAAEAAGCTTLYSEDLGAGQSLRGVLVVNPFVAARREKIKQS